MSFQTDLVAALPRLRRYALSLTREPDAARDLVQSTALRALTSVSPPPKESVLPWLLRIARNVFIDGRRHAARHARAELFDDLTSDVDAGTHVLAVRQALSRLDADLRSVVVMIDVEGMSYGEAAERLGIPPGTVMSRLSRARRRLAVLLADDYGGGSPGGV